MEILVTILTDGGMKPTSATLLAQKLQGAFEDVGRSRNRVRDYAAELNRYMEREETLSHAATYSVDPVTELKANIDTLRGTVRMVEHVAWGLGGDREAIEAAIQEVKLSVGERFRLA